MPAPSESTSPHEYAPGRSNAGTIFFRGWVNPSGSLKLPNAHHVYIRNNTDVADAGEVRESLGLATRIVLLHEGHVIDEGPLATLLVFFAGGGKVAAGELTLGDLVAFNDSPHPLFQKLEPVTSGTLAKVTEFLGSQQARGGTILRPALQTAYRYGNPDRPLNVVILSDGMTEQLTFGIHTRHP